MQSMINNKKAKIASPAYLSLYLCSLRRLAKQVIMQADHGDNRILKFFYKVSVLLWFLLFLPSSEEQYMLSGILSLYKTNTVFNCIYT